MADDLEIILNQASNSLGITPQQLLEGIAEGTVMVGVDPEKVQQHYESIERNIAALSRYIGSVGIDGLETKEIILSQGAQKDLTVSVNPRNPKGYDLKIVVGGSLGHIEWGSRISDKVCRSDREGYIHHQPHPLKEQCVMNRKGLFVFNGKCIDNHTIRRGTVKTYIAPSGGPNPLYEERNFFFQLGPWLKTHGLSEESRKVTKSLQFLPYAVNEGIARAVASTLETPVSR